MGPQGPQGELGAAGPTGPKGAAGEDGATGDDVSGNTWSTKSSFQMTVESNYVIATATYGW